MPTAAPRFHSKFLRRFEARGVYYDCTDPPALDALIKVLQDLRAGVRSGRSIDEVFESANSWRETLLAGRT